MNILGTWIEVVNHLGNYCFKRKWILRFFGMTLIRYCWKSTCEQGNDFIGRHGMARFTRRFVRCHVMARFTRRFIRCHVMTRFNRRFIRCHVMARFTRRFIRCHVMVGSTWRFISYHVMAGCNHRFISCHGVVRLGLPTVYDGYMDGTLLIFLIWYNYC